MAASSEERIAEPAKELAHKTKVIQFLGRTTPIILQNDNGPCPLLAICNILLLKNNLTLSPDIPEVSQEKLLSLVAERLIDSNSNVDNKDAGYVENQQQNIADAIDLLPRLTTGIDVNIKFRRIDDFEFTRECAIFDLLDIPLYHGWIVDPEDNDIVNAIGSKSYNTLMGDLVELETQNAGSEDKKVSEEDSVDFVAATTATLGVPSPCLSRGLSFDESPGSISEHNKSRKGDLEEEAELLRALKLSEAAFPTSSEDILAGSNDEHTMSTNANESAYLKKPELVVPSETSEGNVVGEIQKSCQQELSISDGSNDLANYNNDLITFETIPGQDVCLSSKIVQKIPNGQSSCEESGECALYKDVVEKNSIDALVLREAAVSDSCESDPLSSSVSNTHDSEGAEQVQEQSELRPDVQKGKNEQAATEKLNIASSFTPDADLASSNDGSRQITDAPETFTSSADDSEPIYEGEECILEPGTTACEDREPIYEGEVVLAEQVDKNSRNSSDMGYKNDITPEQGELIKNFLKSSASQLTVYGLVCLQDGLKERELCVFFRNNHFNTMFKFDGELYLLATDQGYINQPDLVWEKLNEVNGNTVFMTGGFKEFKIEENHANNTWDEQNAMATTADYLASIDNPAQEHSSFNSDLQLAIALQQQEFEQQPQRNSQQPTVGGGSRLVTGPQVSRSSGRNLPSSSKPDSKPSKDKCVVM